MSQKCDLFLVNQDMETLYMMETELMILWVKKHLLENASKQEVEYLIKKANISLMYNLMERSGKYFNFNNSQEKRRVYLQMGLLNIAATVRDKGYQVAMYDFGKPNANIIDFIKEVKYKRPKLVGLGPITNLLPQALLIAKCIKEVNSKIIIIMGGHHVTFLDDITLTEHNDIDIIVRGEGEYVMAELVDKLLQKKNINNIESISYRNTNGGIIRNGKNAIIQNLDLLPAPALDITDKAVKYVMNFSLTRGCPYRCTFCCDSAFREHKARKYSTSVIADLLLKIQHQHPNMRIMCSDSNLFLNSKEANKLMNLLPENFFKGHYSSVLMRVNNVTKENCMILEKMGVEEIYLGCENADGRILSDMNKRISFENILSATKIFKENLREVNLSGLWIVGFPTEDYQSVKTNYQAIKELLMNKYLDDVDPNLFVPHPGTDIYKFPQKYGMKILHSKWRNYDYHRKPVFNGKYMNASEIWEYYLNIYKLIIDSEFDKLNISKSKRYDFDNTSHAFAIKLISGLKEFSKKKWGSGF